MIPIPASGHCGSIKPPHSTGCLSHMRVSQNNPENEFYNIENKIFKEFYHYNLENIYMSMYLD